MKTLNFTLALILTLVTNATFANGDNGTTPRRVLTSSSLFTATVKNTNEVFVRTVNNTNSLKVCSCQILNVTNNNNEQEEIVVLSEKTNYGDISGDLKTAGAAIEDAKKQLKGTSYKSVKLVGKQQAATTCAQLYDEVKSQNENVRLYDILNADISNR